MSIDVHGVCSTKLRNNKLFSQDGIQEFMLTLDEYKAMALRFIGAYSGGSSMFKSEDAIDYVVHHLMLGTCRWYGDKRGNHKAYLAQCAKWAIRRWYYVKSKRPQKDIKTISMNASRYKTGEMTIGDTIADLDFVDQQQKKQENAALAHEIIDQAHLTDRQRKCIELIYIDGMRPAEVARELEVSRQAVDQLVNKALAKMRELANV